MKASVNSASVNSTSRNVLTPGMVLGIEMLLVAYRYAVDVHRDHWDFAVEIESLQATGMNGAELRWLVCKGFVRHAEEKADKAKPQRAFRNVGETTFRERSCFVLTQEGFASYKRLIPEK
ncbi:MAG: hypothetical protein ACC628_00480 [Pirellulaceae bacterium]